jgi:hypothetical protein
LPDEVADVEASTGRDLAAAESDADVPASVDGKEAAAEGDADLDAPAAGNVLLFSGRQRWCGHR